MVADVRVPQRWLVWWFVYALFRSLSPQPKGSENQTSGLFDSFCIFVLFQEKWDQKMNAKLQESHCKLGTSYAFTEDTSYVIQQALADDTLSSLRGWDLMHPDLWETFLDDTSLRKHGVVMSSECWLIHACNMYIYIYPFVISRLVMCEARCSHWFVAEEFPGELARIIIIGTGIYIYIYNGNKCNCLNANHQRNTKKNTVSTHESSLGGKSWRKIPRFIGNTHFPLSASLERNSRNSPELCGSRTLRFKSGEVSTVRTPTDGPHHTWLTWPWRRGGEGSLDSCAWDVSQFHDTSEIPSV